jgi:hypothetical protein
MQLLREPKIVDFDFGYVGKEDAKVLDDVVHGVKKRASYWTDIVAACRQHLLHRRIRGVTYNFFDEVHLSCGNHDANIRDDIEHPSHMFILDVFFLDSCDRDLEDMVDTAMKEKIKLVSKSFAHGPGFTSP